MTPTLLLVAHGSRDPRFADTARRVRRAVAARLPGVAVRLSFLDLGAPLLTDELTALDGAVIVVPLLLAPGYHSEVDIPRLVAEVEHPPATVRVTEVVGRASLTEALADRLIEAGLRDDDGILLTAVGSSNPTAGLLVRRRAVELGTRLHRPVDVVFATQLGSHDGRLRAAIRRLRHTGARRIVMSPYFLSAGLLTERVENALDRCAPGSVVAGPIGTHAALTHTIETLYRRHAWATIPAQ